MIKANRNADERRERERVNRFHFISGIHSFYSIIFNFHPQKKNHIK